MNTCLSASVPPPGVESAAIARDIPLLGANPSLPFSIAGRPVEPPEKRPIARYRAISPGYFSTMGIPILKGRDFTGDDNRRAPGAVIVDQAMVRHFWPNQNPIGEQIEPAEGTSRWCTIVGVVGSVRKGGPLFPIYPTMYYSYLQVSAKDIPLVEGSMRLVVRSPLSPATLRTAITRQVAVVSTEISVYGFRTMDEIVSSSMSRSRFNMVLLGIFGLLAIVMAIGGIYALISYSVTQRTHEIGIRMALGAEKGDVLRMVVGQGLKLALIGVAIGIAGALALTRFLSSLLYGVKPTDPLTFIAVSLILIAVALVACYIPARRASKVDPMVALRYE